MNDLVFILAVLVYKKVITKKEANTIKKSLSEGVINGDLSQMIDKITKAFEDKAQDIETISAKDIL